MLRTKEQWEGIYKNEQTPWDTIQPEPYVVHLIEQGIIKPCRAIDLGCGPGNESIFLARKGFQVTGVDISETAIEIARRRAQKVQAECTFVVSDVLTLSLAETYDFVLDRACFHFLDPGERQKYIEKVKELMNQNALFLLFVSSDQETPKGTYQFSKRDIETLFSPTFEILSLELVELKTHKEKPLPYVCLMRKR